MEVEALREVVLLRFIKTLRRAVNGWLEVGFVKLTPGGGHPANRRKTVPDMRSLTSTGGPGRDCATPDRRSQRPWGRGREQINNDETFPLISPAGG